MAEKEVVVLNWDDVKVTDFKPKKIVRTVGEKAYELEYKDINGDTYSDLVLRARMEAKDDLDAKKLVSKNLRENIIHSIAGKEYNEKSMAVMDREMPAWIREDTEQFLVQYVSGNI